MTALYRISAAKTDLFYRAGLGWPKAGVVVNRADFTPDAWATLTAETMLTVAPVAEAAADGPGDLTDLVREAIGKLEAADFAANGVPKVAAVRAALPQVTKGITGALVAGVWADLKAGP